MDSVMTVLIGAFIGLNSGMFGIGGALLATPLLRLVLGLPEIVSVATPLPAAIPAAISGSLVYLRGRLVRFDVAWRTLLTAIPMSQAGVYMTGRTSGTVLMILTGVMLAYSAWVFIERGFSRTVRPVATSSTAEPPRPSGLLYVGGALAGFLSGFLAIGGGMVLMPIFVRLLRMETKDAVATSLFCVVALAIPGTIGHSLEGNIDWNVAMLLAAGVVPFGYLGASLMTKLRTRTLERLYGILMLVFALYFVFAETL